jgi:hypothetical protein
MGESETVFFLRVGRSGIDKPPPAVVLVAGVEYPDGAADAKSERSCGAPGV